MEAFRLALRLGADGLESDVWLTRDGIAVLDHDGVVRRGLRSRPISAFDAGDLPPHVPRLADLLAEIPPDLPLSLDVKDVDAFDAVATECRASRPTFTSRTFLCHPDFGVLSARRGELHDLALVHSTRLAKMTQGPERHAARMHDSGLDVVNMPYPEWNGGLVALFGRFGLRSFAWNCQHVQQIRAVLAMKVDAIYSDWPDRVFDVITTRATSTD
jgi:glycerophosphoryl diester phosphodiesterase